MPLQELSPLPPVSGYGILGNVLANVGDRIATTARQDQLLTRQRQQQLEDAGRTRGEQLQDVQSQRDYLDRVRHQEGEDKMKDFTTQEYIRQGLALKTALINEGILNPAQANDPEALQAAWLEAQRRGLDKVYQELLTTPGEDGKPLLSEADLSNPSRVDAAKDALAAIKAKQLQFSMQQPHNAQQSIETINQQLAGIRSQKDAATQRANQPVPQFNAADPRVMQLAAQMAEQNKPGSGRNREAVAAMVPMAQKELQAQAMQSWAEQTQSAKIELESLRRSEAELTGTMERMMSTFKVAPSVAPTAAPGMAPMTAVPGAKPATTQDIAGALDSLLGGNKAQPAGAPTGQSLIANPTSNPVIARGNDAIAQQQKVQAQTALNEAIEAGKAIDAQLQQAGSPVSFAPVGAGGGGIAPYRAPDPIVAAQTTTKLLQQKAANDSKIQTLRSQLLGPVPASVTPAAVNTATSSTPSVPFQQPAWWQAGPQTSPGP